MARFCRRCYATTRCCQVFCVNSLRDKVFWECGVGRPAHSAAHSRTAQRTRADRARRRFPDLVVTQRQYWSGSYRVPCLGDVASRPPSKRTTRPLLRTPSSWSWVGEKLIGSLIVAIHWHCWGWPGTTDAIDGLWCRRRANWGGHLRGASMRPGVGRVIVHQRVGPVTAWRLPAGPHPGTRRGA